MSDAGVTGQPQEQPPVQKPDAYAPTTTLDQLKKMFDDSRTQTQEARVESCVHRDYYDCYQYTDVEEKILQARMQPAITNNRVRRAIDGITGVVEQSKTDPRAYMRNPPEPQQQPQPQPQAPQMGQPQPGQQVMGGNGGPAMEPDLDAGDVASMTLRFIADTNHFHPLKMDVLENGLVEGSGAAIIECIDQEVLLTQIRWEEFFYDPRSRKPDFSDARYLGVAKWMYADTAASIYPEKKQAILDTASGQGNTGIGSFDASWEDRPDNVCPWIDTRQRRLMVVEMYYLEAQKWARCVFIANDILEQTLSPYKDDKGRETCPIVAWSCYVDRYNRRYGVIRDMRGMQDEINKRRSKAMHEINTRQIQQVDPNAPPVDVDSARAEAARPDGVLPSGYNVVPRQDVVANNLELLTEAKAEIERMSPNPAILGRQGADASGRAQQVRQQAGLIELARVLGRFNDFELRCYRQMWARARQFWSDPKWIRVTNDEGAPKYVRVNEPAQTDPMTGQPVGQPKNHIAQMDVDIVVDTIPNTATLQQEMFQDLAQIAQAYGPAAVPFPIILELSSVPKKREIIKKLEAFQAAQVPQQQAQQQGAMAKLQADIAEIQSVIRKNNTQADLNEANTVTTAMKGHLEVTHAAQLPPGVVLNGSGTPVPVNPPPPGATGDAGSVAA